MANRHNEDSAQSARNQLSTIEQLDILIGYLYKIRPSKRTCGEIKNEALNDVELGQIQALINHMAQDYFVELEVIHKANSVFEPREVFGISIKGVQFYEKSKVQSRPYYSRGKKEALSRYKNSVDTLVRWVFPAIAIIVSVLSLVFNRSSQQDTSIKIQTLQREIKDLKDSMKPKANVFKIQDR